jgi:putative endonuclease
VYRLADAARDRGRRRFWPRDLASGRRAEDLAHRFLRRRGMVIVARNYRPPFGGGEIDLIGWDRDKLAIVEVKSRATAEFGDPEHAVDQEKQRFLERAAPGLRRRAGVRLEPRPLRHRERDLQRLPASSTVRRCFRAPADAIIQTLAGTYAKIQLRAAG